MSIRVDHGGSERKWAQFFVQLPCGAEGEGPCETKKVSTMVLVWVSETLVCPAGIRRGRESATKVVRNIIIVDDRDGKLCLDMIPLLIV